ncbi:MAG: hypothetical protein WKG07_44905 [Hymenobacter sp.]
MKLAMAPSSYFPQHSFAYFAPGSSCPAHCGGHPAGHCGNCCGYMCWCSGLAEAGRAGAGPLAGVLLGLGAGLLTSYAGWRVGRAG